ncbi:MAG: 50S ribosomal protein L19e [archaeon]|nr:50S ribosomal protein L19e [archaeon]
MIIKKKELAAKTLKVGKGRIKFVKLRLDEIKEAITKQDIRDLVLSGAILVKPIKGRRVNEKRKNKKGPGKIKKKVNKRKKDYVKITRKLRKHVKHLKKQGEISNEEFKKLRKEIRNKSFKSKTNLKLNIEGKSKGK